VEQQRVDAEEVGGENAVCLVSEKRSPGRGRDVEERARRQLKYRCQSFKIGLVC
jgi:hypothetical protein